MCLREPRASLLTASNTLSLDPYFPDNTYANSELLRKARQFRIKSPLPFLTSATNFQNGLSVIIAYTSIYNPDP